MFGNLKKNVVDSSKTAINFATDVAWLSALRLAEVHIRSGLVVAAKALGIKAERTKLGRLVLDLAPAAILWCAAKWAPGIRPAIRVTMTDHLRMSLMVRASESVGVALPAMVAPAIAAFGSAVALALPAATEDSSSPPPPPPSTEKTGWTIRVRNGKTPPPPSTEKTETFQMKTFQMEMLKKHNAPWRCLVTGNDRMLCGITFSDEVEGSLHILMTRKFLGEMVNGNDLGVCDDGYANFESVAREPSRERVYRIYCGRKSFYLRHSEVCRIRWWLETGSKVELNDERPLK